MEAVLIKILHPPRDSNWHEAVRFRHNVSKRLKIHSKLLYISCNEACPGHAKSVLWLLMHYSDVIMSAFAPQITSVSIVCSTFWPGPDHQSFASLAFVRKEPVTRKMFPFDDVIMDLFHCFVRTPTCTTLAMHGVAVHAIHVSQSKKYTCWSYHNTLRPGDIFIKPQYIDWWWCSGEPR